MGFETGAKTFGTSNCSSSKLVKEIRPVTVAYMPERGKDKLWATVLAGPPVSRTTTLVPRYKTVDRDELRFGASAGDF